MPRSLDGALKLVVVGASTGLGRCLGLGLAQRGARVALLGRRKELLEDAARQIGSGGHAIVCDVTDEASCQAAVEEAAGELGGIDGAVYCPGIGILGRLEDFDGAAWRSTYETNVIGAGVFTAAALPYLKDTYGTVAYLSSISASFAPPYPGMASYNASKAAMDKLVEAWRVEHPDVGFTRVVVGDCAGGEGLGTSQFMSSWDPELFAQLHAEWEDRRLVFGSVYDVAELVHMVDAVLRCGVTATVPTITIIPRGSPPAISIEELAERLRG